MKYCPKCKKLYNDEDTVCVCDECKKKQLKEISDGQTSVFLCSGDVIERDRVQAALGDSGIPSVYTRHMVTANSQLITGRDFDGFDILVPYELYEKAYDVAVGIGAIELEGAEIVEEDIPDGADEPEEMSSAKRTTVRVISAILLILLFAGVIYGTDFIVNAIKSLFT